MVDPMATESNLPAAPRRAYLDGIDGYEPTTSWTKPEEDRQPRWAAQQARYGFDDRQTWSLNTAMVELLYERLQMYYTFASEHIDLDLHKFEFEGRELTQREAVLKLIQLGAIILEDEELEGPSPTNRFWSLWTIVHPVMWW